MQKQDETHSLPLTNPPTDMDSELLITLVKGAVTAITTRLQSKWYKNLKTLDFRFSCERKTFRKGNFLKTMCNDNHVISLTEVSSKKSNMTCHCNVCKFLQLNLNEKHLMRLQSEAFVFKFLWRSIWTGLNSILVLLFSISFLVNQGITCSSLMFLFFRPGSIRGRWNQGDNSDRGSHESW